MSRFSVRKPLPDQVQADREGRLEAEHAVQRRVELELLLLRRVRRVVGGDGVDGAVGEPLAQRLHVLGRAQRRIHLEVRIVVARRDVLVGEGQVVGRHLRGDREAAPPGLAQGADAAGRGDVAEVEAPAGQLEQGEVAKHHDVLGLGRDPLQPQPGGRGSLVHDPLADEVQVLLVDGQRQAEGARVLEGTPHQRRRHHRASVVGEGHAARRPELAVLGQLLALAPLADRTHRVDPGQAGRRGAGQHELGHAGVVVGGDRVGHGTHGGEAACHGRAGAGGDGLLVLLPRLAQVHVEVDEARGDPLPPGVHHVRAGGRLDPLGDHGHLAAAQDHRPDAVDAAGGIDDPPALDDDHVVRVAHAETFSARSSPAPPARR